MKSNTQSHSEHINVRHSFLLTLLLGVSCLFLSLTAPIGYARTNAVTSYLFVTATDSNQVSAVDPTTGQVAQYISVGTHPIRIAIRPDGLRAFVSNTGSNTVSVINTQTLTQVSTISVGNSPQELDCSPDGKRVYVVHQGDNRVFVINAMTGAVIAQITIAGNEARDVLVRPDSKFAYVANYANGSVDVITASNGSVNSITAAAGTRRLAITPDGAYLLATDYLGDMVTVIRTSDNSFVTNIGVGHQPRGIAITPDGLKTYVTNVNTLGTVSVIDNSDWHLMSTINVGDTPWHVIVPPSPNSRYAYVSNSGSALQSSSISIIDTTTDTVSKTLTPADGVGNGPFFSVVNPGHNKLFVSNSRETVNDTGGTVSVINLQTQTLLSPITNIGSQPFDLMFNTP
jgi:YVTN family beta-propeller protein